MPEVKREIVVRHLTEYALAWGAWLRDEGANDRMSYPELIKTLRVPEWWEKDCLELGRDRNRVKHRGPRDEAERYVEKYEQAAYSVAHDVTGIDAMPRSAHMLR